MIDITSIQEYISNPDFWNGKNVRTFMGFFGCGLTTVLSDFVLQEENKNYVYIDCYDITEVTEYNALRHILYEISKSQQIIKDCFNLTELVPSKIDYYSLVQLTTNAFRKIISSDRKLIIILDHFDLLINLSPYFFENFRKVLQLTNKECPIKILLAMDRYVDGSKLIRRFGNFYPYVFAYVESVKGFNTDDINDALKNNVDNSQEVAQWIMGLSSGNPKLVDRILEIVAPIIVTKKVRIVDFDMSVFTKDFVINYSIEKLWDSLDTEQQKFLINIYLQKPLSEISSSKLNYLQGTGLIKIDKDKKYINMKLLELFLSYKYQSKISSKPKANIYTDRFSPQEFAIYKLLKESKGEIISKEQVAQVLWGKKTKKNKQKGWAIDQLMKRLRKKINDNEGLTIQTIRGRGYRLSLMPPSCHYHNVGSIVGD